MNVCRSVVFAGILIFFCNAAFAQEILLSFEAAEGPGAVPPPRDADGFIPTAPATPVTPSPVIAPPANTIPPAQNPEIWMPAAPPTFVYVPDMPVYAPSCPWWRPCGPGHTWGGNKLFYQGAYGADFRFACANHDACLMNPCNSRYACDRQFLDQMCAACMMSDNPAACMHKAHKYYVLVRVFGVFYRW